MTSPAIHPCFLGPYGENDTLLEKLMVEFLRDHVYWRRNFHPEDPPAIPTRAAQHPSYQAFEARMRPSCLDPIFTLGVPRNAASPSALPCITRTTGFPRSGRSRLSPMATTASASA